MEVIVYFPDDKHEIGMIVIETRKYRKYIQLCKSKELNYRLWEMKRYKQPSDKAGQSYIRYVHQIEWRKMN